MFASVLERWSLLGDDGVHWEPWPIYPVSPPIIKPSALPCPHRRRSFCAGVFSAEAGAYVDYIDPKVVLIDGRRLAELVIDFDVGVNAAPTYGTKRVDSDYFDDSGAV